MNNIYDVIIIGSGPGGLSAGIYSARSKLKTLIIEKKFIWRPNSKYWSYRKLSRFYRR